MFAKSESVSGGTPTEPTTTQLDWFQSRQHSPDSLSPCLSLTSSQAVGVRWRGFRRLGQDGADHHRLLDRGGGKAQDRRRLAGPGPSRRHRQPQRARSHQA